MCIRDRANTISALKILPANHASAIHFRQDFIYKFKSFLDQYQQLELEIGEFASFIKENKSIRMKFPVKVFLSFL
jgi:hypothetical protein